MHFMCDGGSLGSIVASLVHTWTWEGNVFDSDSLSMFDLGFGQAITLWGPPPSAPLQYWAY